MPRQFTSYEPDAIDCNALWTAICHDFGMLPSIETRYERDTVVTIVKCRLIGGTDNGVVQVQALASAPLRANKSQYVQQYGALLDCWHQLDRGVLAIAGTRVERGWDGRPVVPARRRK